MGWLNLKCKLYVINEVWEALGHMAEKEAVILHETYRD